VTPHTFADLLRRHRLARRLTQLELAETANLGPDTIGGLERGAGKGRPRLATLKNLAEALQLSSAERDELYAAALGQWSASQADRPKDNLPCELSVFIGREADGEAIGRLLDRHRLVTLTGPPGVGKTRLAIRVAQGLTGTLPDGVWLVDLAPLADADLVPRAVAAVVGAPTEAQGTIRTALADALRRRRLLLVLDNCEHLLDACARLAEDLLRACPNLRVLVTSRERLACDGEAVWPVLPLAVPPQAGTAALSAADALGFEAVQLFVERATAARPGLLVTDAQATTVAEVCRRLDGLPLALALAAATVRGLSIQQVAAGLADRFRLLAGGSRTAPCQQSLRTALDWSYAHMPPDERTLFDRLSVFHGSFTLESATAVCADEGAAVTDTPAPAAGEWVPVEAVRDLILQLVDKSMVLREDRDTTVGGRRQVQHQVSGYRLLETLREYGRDRLAQRGLTQQMQRRHFHHYLDLIEQATVEGPASHQVKWQPLLDAERQILWAALRWLRDTADVQASGRLDLAVSRMVERLAAPGVGQVVTPLFFELRRLRLPGYAHLERAILSQSDLPTLAASAGLYHVIGDWAAELAVLRRRLELGPDERSATQIRMRTARLLLVQQDMGKALQTLSAVVETATARGDELLLLEASLEQGFAYAQSGDCFKGREACALALTLLERLRPGISAETYSAKRLAGLHTSACVAHNADDNEAGAASLAEAYELARALDDRPQAALMLVNLADFRWGAWRYGEAIEAYRQAEDASADACYPEGREFALLGRGIVLWSIGRYAPAEEALHEGLAVARELNDVWGTAYGLTYLSNVQAGRGELRMALGTSREAVALAEGLGAEYLRALARLYHFWHWEVVAPGHPAHAHPIEETLRRAQALGCDGLAVQLGWLRLLHQVADATLAEEDLAQRLRHVVQHFPIRRPMRGVPELLASEVALAMRRRRLAVETTELHRLIARITDEKAGSLKPAEQEAFRDARRSWRAT
jgi:predicted ATPase